ncbi:MAG: DUF3999 family protein [Janthinobacterium lividum]
MSRLPCRSALAMTATFLLSAADRGDAPADYRVRARVTPVAGASVQRVELPGAVLAALHRADGGDLRLFDAGGRRVPIARIGAPPVRERTVTLAPLPIVGAAGGAVIAGLSLRLDESGDAPVARVDAASDGEGDAGRADTVGALLDARGVAGTARSLAVDAGLPAGQPVTLAVEASPDLRTWRPLAEQVAYHPSPAPAPERLPLGDAPLAREWLRITWRASTRLVAPVAISRAALTVVPVGTASGPVVTVRLPPQPDPHAIELALPFATPLSGLGIAPVTDAIVPVRLGLLRLRSIAVVRS